MTLPSFIELWADERTACLLQQFWGIGMVVWTPNLRH
jgi:hypothetical protein